ncbi:MAG UNVERIFIED_CONTAM: hypothetical protein LVR18_25300 [Planctomycetaceae bacterium]
MARRARIRRLREIFEACEVFDKAEVLVERLRAKADALLEEITDVPIRDLLRFLQKPCWRKNCRRRIWKPTRTSWCS